MLIDALLGAGFAVQLAHDETDHDELSPQDHGFVRIKGSNGDVLATDASFQHNRAYHERTQRTEALVKTFKEAVDVTEEKDTTKPVPSDSEGSTKAASCEEEAACVA